MDLVTGSTGFIGGVLVEELVRRGRKVKAFVRSTSDDSRLRNLPIDIVVGDILDQELILCTTWQQESP
jgi:dihydroflavonol-4-reductase